MNDDLKIALYLQLFKGREDCFAQQGEDWYFLVAKPFDEFYLGRHLEGDATFGLYVLDSESRCNLICIDVDIPKNDVDKIDIADSSTKYDHLKSKLHTVVDILYTKLGVPLESILLEETGGRGYHIWIFFSSPLKGDMAVIFGEIVKMHLNFEIEVFPKQGRLTVNRKYGNLIKLPLGIHRKYGSRSVFFSLSKDGPLNIDGIKSNLDHLASILPIDPDILLRATRSYKEELLLQKETYAHPLFADAIRPEFEGQSTTIVVGCLALRNIYAKASRGDALSRSEAFHFANVMLSVPEGEKYIYETMQMSYKQDYDEQMTRDELERIKPLLPTNCSTLKKRSLCPGYCKDSVRKRNEDQLASNTSPCSVWLKRKRLSRVDHREDIRNLIAKSENFRRAFFELKLYHEHEDSLFFDPFDFQHFESNLDSNCEIMAKALIEKIEIPFSGYLTVLIPKKLNDSLELEYRRMSYSTVYDQVPIQAVFNVIGPVIEEEFQRSSYGYRWNLDATEPYRIFEDWRESYPRFRNEILAALRRYPNGYHVCCDIKGYYDHIDHEILLEQLRGLVPDKYIFHIIEDTVRAYEIEKGSGKGLPQGPAFARILANLFLNQFDILAAQVTSSYFRYVDDFVLVFESRTKAEEGLGYLVRRLAELGLGLCQDEAKKPSIEPNTDLTKVHVTLNKIQYGILEATKHIRHLDPQDIVDFGNALERHSASPEDLEQLIKINEALPSLLYVATQPSLLPHPLKSKLAAIISILIRRHLFYPKKLKTIFYRLLELESNAEILLGLFRLMEPAHKIYFILSVFGRWQTRDEHRELLRAMVELAIGDANSMVWGFAVAISSDPNLGIDVSSKWQALRDRMSQGGGRFGLIKWVATINYYDLSPDNRKQFMELVGPDSSDFLKMLLFSKLSRFPTMYVDTAYLKGVLQKSGILILGAVSALLAGAIDEGVLFENLISYALSRLAFKPLFISLLTKQLFNRSISSGLAELENIKSLYTKVSDVELKKSVLNTLSRIMNYSFAFDIEFAKLHKEIDRYNECFFFKRVVAGASYNYLELIPESRLRNYFGCDLDSVRNIVEDLSAKSVILPSVFNYDSRTREIRLELKDEGRFRELDRKEFSKEPEYVLRGLELAAQAYKKASYFRRLTGKVPPISIDNLLLDIRTNTVVFRTLGQSLCTPHFFRCITVGDEESDIAKMVAFFLQDLLFENETKAREFLGHKPHSGIEAFLGCFIENMNAKEPAHRYSCSRFDYLVGCLADSAGLNELQICIIYLRERLKGVLFRHNSGEVRWNGICQAVKDHLSDHLRDVGEPRVFRESRFKNHLLFANHGRRNLHTLSREFLNVVLNRRDLIGHNWADVAYFDLIEFLLLYCIICVEVASLGRLLDGNRVLSQYFSDKVPAPERIRIIAGEYSSEFASSELASILVRESEDDPYEKFGDLSLQLLGLRALLASGAEISENTLNLKKPDGMSREVFRKFAHACLIRIPQIEKSAHKVVNSVLSALQSNDDYARPQGLDEIRDAVEIIAEDLRLVRRDFDIKRLHGQAEGRYFPPDIRCRSWLRRTIIVNDRVLPGFALTNSFPSSRDGYACSWDKQGNTVKNLIIPSEGVSTIIRDLRRGKLFGYKLSFLYHGKAMIFWDMIALILDALFLAICEQVKGSNALGGTVKGVCVVGTYLFGTVAVSLAGKLLVYDLRYWASWYRRITRFLRSTWEEEKKDTPEK